MWTNRGMGGVARESGRAAFWSGAAGTGILRVPPPVLTIVPTIVVVLAATSGCGRPAAPPAVAAAPRLQRVDHEGLLRILAERRGRVIVLDCWSTSCPPCVKEFPRLVALEARYRGRVECMSLAFDFEGLGSIDEAADRVAAFLRQVGAGRIVNLLATEEADVMYRKMELDSVPAVYVWRPDGSLARRFDANDSAARLGRPFTYEDVELEVRSLLEP